jgi:aminopeptidase
MLRETMSVDSEYVRPLAELTVRFGANVQPGQIVAIGSEPGKEPLARAIAEAAYERGALFVDLQVFDIHLKHARIQHSAPDDLDYVPPWIGDRVLALGEHRGARITLTGNVAPHLMDDVDPALLGRDMLPSVKESLTVVNARTTNWTVVPCPTADWAGLVYRDVDPDEALARLWREIGHVCRLDDPDPVAAWRARFERLAEVAEKLNALRLDALRYEGPGTDLTIGLLPGSRWHSGAMATVDGIVHAPNLPTEEVFTSPDPDRVDGVVRATKPLFTAGELIEGLRVRFDRGRAVEIDADRGAGTLRTLAARDEGAARLGEVALVDRESRVGGLETVFFNTLLDENAASHIALGQGIALTAEDERDRERINTSQIHVDFMIGSDELDITGITDDGREVPLLQNAAWRL